MRISDWRSDVCSSDLRHRHRRVLRTGRDDAAVSRRTRVRTGRPALASISGQLAVAGAFPVPPEPACAMAPAVARRNPGRPVGDPGSIITRDALEGLAPAPSWRDPAGLAVARRLASARMALPATDRVATLDRPTCEERVFT